MAERPTIRVFISSPSDVRPERLLAERIVARLDNEFAHYFHVEAVLWEREPLVATHHFQDPRNIPEPRDANIVIVILWARLGVPLPEDRFRGAISGLSVTGTEWEFEDALKAARDSGVPALMLYRKTKAVTETVSVVASNDAALEEDRRQRRLVMDFMNRWFGDTARGAAEAASTTFETTEEFEDKLYEHLRALLERRISGKDAAAAVRWHAPPYRGLLSFDLEYAPVFFGRTRARNDVRECLAAQAKRGQAFVLVLGASGSGKSSLIKAGVLSDLMLPGMVGRVALCRYAIVRPSDEPTNPNAALADALLRETALPELQALRYTTGRLVSVLAGGAEQISLAIEQGLAEAGKSAGLTSIGEARLVLIVDQLEELFTIATLTDEDRSRFVAALESLARSGVVWVIATMRSDFFDRLEGLPALAHLADESARYLLLPPTDAELVQMIREPAREAGLRFEVDAIDGTPLDDRIREAARNREALPLLSFVLDELWKQRTDRGLLTTAAYKSLGGLEGALARRAEAEFAAQPPEVRDALPRVLRALATVGSEGQIVSRVAPLGTFPDGSSERRLIETFVSPEARLFVKDIEHGVAEPMVRVAHEALLTHWQRAKDYLEANRADLQLEARLTDAAARWQRATEADRPSLLLARGLPLEEAADLLRRRGDELSPGAREFVAQSDSAAAAGAKRRRAIVAAVIAALALLAVLSTSALVLAERTRDDALIAQSRFLARDAQDSVDRGNAELGVLLALRALPQRIDRPDRPFVREAASTLESAVANFRETILSGHRDVVLSAAFSPDGRRVVTGSFDKTARVWDPRSGQSLFVLIGHQALINSAAFSPDSQRIVTASDDKTARLWDAQTGAPLAVLAGHRDTVIDAEFSPDGRRIVTSSADRTARIWDARTGAALEVLKGHTGSVLATFSPDGRRVLTASDDKTARVWDALTGTTIAVFHGHEDAVNSATLSPDGRRVVTASSDNTARLWDVSSGAPLAVLRGHEDVVTSALFSRDGRRVVTASADKTARLWDSNGAPLTVLRGHEAPVSSAEFSPDGRWVVTASDDKTARLWDAETGAALAVLAGHQGRLTQAMFAPDGRRVVTASWDKTARVWDAHREAPLGILRLESKVGAAAFSPDGRRIVTGSGDTAVRVWDAQTGALLATFRGHQAGVASVAFSPDGRRIVTASADKTARIWDATTGATVAILRGHSSNVASVAFSPDDRRIVTASYDKTVRLWDARTGAMLRVFRGHRDKVLSAAFSPDGKRIASASWDATARVWDAETGGLLAVLTGHEGRVKTVAFSPDGRRIATASWDKTARLWDALTGAQLLVLRGHDDPVSSVAFSPDGRRIATSSRDKTARLWDSFTGAPLGVLKGHTNDVEDVAFSPDGRRIITTSQDGTARIWDAGAGPPPHCQPLIDLAHKLVPRSLSEEERAREFVAQPVAAPFLQLASAGDKCE